MTMIELQNVLGNELDKLIAGTTQPEDAKAVALLAKQMINNADIILRADKFTNQDGSRINRIVGDINAKTTSVD